MAEIIGFYHKGDWKKTTSFLERALEAVNLGVLDKYGKMGVEALEMATPMDSGQTAASWYYEIEQTGDSASIIWRNSNLSQDWFPIAIYLQYGHATKNGGWVDGIDYVNPALQPIFEKMAGDIWKELK